MRIGIVVSEPGASARVRALQHVPAWQSRGAEVRWLAWSAPAGRPAVARRSAEVLALAGWADVVMLQKPVSPPALVRALRATNRRLVVDLDDATWVGGRSRVVEPARLKRVAATVAAAQAVVVGSEHLGNMLTGVMPVASQLHVLRPAVEVPDVPPAGDRMARRPVVAGWIGSPQNLADFQPTVLEALGSLVRRDVLTVRIISTAGFASDVALPHELVPWTERGEAAAVAEVDVGLMPLADDLRSRGRCGYKAIQMMAAGVPVIASPVGCSVELVGGGRGLLASSVEQWSDALSLLASQPDQRRAHGDRGHAWVAAEASAPVVGAHLLDILCDVARAPRWG